VVSLLVFIVVVVVLLSLAGATNRVRATQNGNMKSSAVALQPNSLCAKSERIIFSCLSKRSGSKLFKLVSLCGSRDLSKERGYLQYRYGLPGKVELEFPSSRTGTQQLFTYHHYLRYRVDLTEINFEINDYQYQIFNDYNGEEKREESNQGVTVTPPNQGKEITFLCRSKVKADYINLEDVLNRAQG
jgi:hypothetical protein